MKDDRVYLDHIARAIARIEQYSAPGRDEFFVDTKTQDAVLRNLQTLAESTQRLSSELKAAHPEIDWRNIAAFRNVVVHDYLGVSLERVWDIVHEDLPTLKARITAIIEEGEPWP